MRLWKCPTCSHAHRAPERMKASDVRRFCRDCSWATGFLVELVAPALESKREAATTARLARAKKERQRQSAAKQEAAAAAEQAWIVGDMDMRDELRRVCAQCPEWRAIGVRAGTADEILARMSPRRRTAAAHSSGHAYLGTVQRPGRSTVTLGLDLADAWHTMMHEALHAIGLEHGREMRILEIAATRSRWGVTAALESSGWKQSQAICAAIRNTFRQPTENP